MLLIRAVAFLLALGLTGCATQTQPQALAELPPLPPVASLPCCWLSQEQVIFTAEDGEHALLTAVQRNQQALTVVVLDGTGLRLLTLVYGEDGVLQELTTPPDWPSAYSTYLVAAIFMHRGLHADWGADWQLRQQDHTKILAHRGQPVITLDYAVQHESARPRTVHIAGSGLSMAVSTVSDAPL